MNFNELVSLSLLAQRGIKGFYQNVFEKLFLNEDGSLKIKCVDKKRRIFMYKNEDGVLIRDEKLKQFIEDYVSLFAGRLRALRWEITSEIIDTKQSTEMCCALSLKLPRPNFPAYIATECVP